MTLPNPHFENSYARVFGRGIGMNKNADVFFARFYEHFLATPEVAEMFADTDLQQQQLMLKKSLITPLVCSPQTCNAWPNGTGS